VERPQTATLPRWCPVHGSHRPPADSASCVIDIEDFDITTGGALDVTAALYSPHCVEEGEAWRSRRSARKGTIIDMLATVYVQSRNHQRKPQAMDDKCTIGSGADKLRGNRRSVGGWMGAGLDWVFISSFSRCLAFLLPCCALCFFTVNECSCLVETARPYIPKRNLSSAIPLLLRTARTLGGCSPT
jgi:hypothetical protein